MAKGDVETYHEDGQWKNRIQGNHRASNTAETKAEAQAKGRQMAQERGVEHIIKKRDSTIGERNIYPRLGHPKGESWQGGPCINASTARGPGAWRPTTGRSSPLTAVKATQTKPTHAIWRIASSAEKRRRQADQPPRGVAGLTELI
jgi:hypothetical protein